MSHSDNLVCLVSRRAVFPFVQSEGALPAESNVPGFGHLAYTQESACVVVVGGLLPFKQLLVGDRL